MAVNLEGNVVEGAVSIITAGNPGGERNGGQGPRVPIRAMFFYDWNTFL